jgi:GMP synthase-like glutamine amidotransferase
MRVHFIQQVSFEGPGLIADWAYEAGHEVSLTLAPTEDYPSSDDFEFLVVLGGPMNADDVITSPWLRTERRFVAEAIACGKLVLGVCLGAQIVAEIVGGAIHRNTEPEIGWYPVTLADSGRIEPLFADWPEHVVVGHWHSDTFDLPFGLKPVLSSEVTANQAFVFDYRVVGLQFHLEWDESAVGAMLAAEPIDHSERGLHVMSTPEILDETPDRIPLCRELLFTLLDGLDSIGPLPGNCR